MIEFTILVVVALDSQVIDLWAIAIMTIENNTAKSIRILPSLINFNFCLNTLPFTQTYYRQNTIPALNWLDIYSNATYLTS